MRETGEIIKKYREQTGLTAVELAEKLNISQVLLTYLENDNRNLSAAVFEQMLKVFPKDICDEIKEYEDYKKTPDSIKFLIKKLESGFLNEDNFKENLALKKEIEKLQKELTECRNITRLKLQELTPEKMVELEKFITYLKNS